MLQAGAVPFRIVDSRPEVLLVTSRSSRWIFPKGHVEPGETPEAAAAKEVEEECGIVGVLSPAPIATYRDRREAGDCQVLMYLLEYSGESERWRESANRARKWCSFELAESLLTKEKLREVLGRARERILSRDAAG